jgi:hypothetical protein
MVTSWRCCAKGSFSTVTVRPSTKLLARRLNKLTLSHERYTFRVNDHHLPEDVYAESPRRQNNSVLGVLRSGSALCGNP